MNIIRQKLEPEIYYYPHVECPIPVLEFEQLLRYITEEMQNNEIIIFEDQNHYTFTNKIDNPLLPKEYKTILRMIDDNKKPNIIHDITIYQDKVIIVTNKGTSISANIGDILLLFLTKLCYQHNIDTSELPSIKKKEEKIKAQKEQEAYENSIKGKIVALFNFIKEQF